MYSDQVFALLILTMVLSLAAEIILSVAGVEVSTSWTLAAGAFASLCLLNGEKRLRIRW
jgi:hypothetical protein